MANKKVVSKKRKRRKLRYKRVLGLIVVLVALIYGSFVVYGMVMDRHVENMTKTQEEVIESSARDTKPSIDAQYNDARFKSFTNILLIGVDDANSDDNWDKGRNADAIELLSFDDEKDELRIITIPRNLIINTRNGNNIPISQIYYEDGGTATVNALAQYLEIPITQYIAVDRKALKEMVDALGGVSLYVPENMDYEDPADGTAIHVAKGYQHLDGQKAIEYISYRSDSLGDSGRLQRQQQFLKLLYEKFTSVEGIKAAPKIFKIMKNNTDTNMKVVSISSMVDYINAFTDDNIVVKMLPGSSDAQGNWVVNPSLVKMYMESLFPIPEEEEK